MTDWTKDLLGRPLPWCDPSPLKPGDPRVVVLDAPKPTEPPHVGIITHPSPRAKR